MRITLQIIKCHNRQDVPCIVLDVESQKYFFNIIDSFPRFFGEHSCRFKKNSRIFFTRLTADHLTGLYEVFLALIEKKLSENSQVYGPPGLSAHVRGDSANTGRKRIAYGIYDFFNNGEKLLGIKTTKFLEELVFGGNFNKTFMRLNEFLAEKQKTNPENVSDPEDYVRDKTYYKDENVEIHPTLLSGSGEDPSIKPSLCYIIKPDKIIGKFNSDKLKAHKIQGKDVKKLLEAGEIEINGSIHYIKEFKDPDSPAPIVIIIDCPTVVHLESLIKQDKICQLFADSIRSEEEDLKAIIHITPGNVLSDPRYGEFLQKFQKSCQHIFVSQDVQPIELKFKSQHNNEETKVNKEKKKEPKNEEVAAEDRENQLKYKHFLFTNVFAKYYPNHFPVLNDVKPDGAFNLDKLFPFLVNKSTYHKLVELVLAPINNEGFHPIPCPLDKAAKALVNYTENDTFLEKYKRCLDQISQVTGTDQKMLKLFKNCDPEVVFLGTQAMLCSKYFNNTAIYLRFWQQGNIGMLLDCGEGTYFQLLHHYGSTQIREVLKNLRVIFISHQHCDHRIGLIQIIKERDRIFEEEKLPKDPSPIFLALPFNCGSWIEMFSETVEYLNCRIVFTQHLKIETSKTKRYHDLFVNNGQENQEETKLNENNGLPNDSEDELEMDKEFSSYSVHQGTLLQEQKQKSLENIPLLEEFLSNSLGVYRFRAVKVDHCLEAYAVYFQHQDGWSFLYSGDSRPCSSMIEEVGEATILVHEATFSHEMKDQAVDRRHSTDQEAAEVGIKLKAWRTILTHFSQRYDRIGNEKAEDQPIKDEIDDYARNNVVKTWDHFRFKFSELEFIPMISKSIGYTRAVDVVDHL